MTRLHLTALWVCIAGGALDVAGSTMCKVGWVYHSITETCLRATPVTVSRGFHSKDTWKPCQNTTGGTFGNVTVSSQFPGSDNLLTYFMPRKPIPFTDEPRNINSIVVICQVKAGPVGPPVCPRDVKLVSVSDSNATLSWSPGQLSRKVSVYIKVKRCDGLVRKCTDGLSKTFWDVTLFRPENYTVTGLQSNTTYMLTWWIWTDKSKTEDCNVTLSLTTKEEPPKCPYFVDLVSVSNRNATLKWWTQESSRQVIMKITAQICNSLAAYCQEDMSRTFPDSPLSREQNYVFTELQPNTKYIFGMQIETGKDHFLDCKWNVTLTTEEEAPVAMTRTEQRQDSTDTVIWFSIALTITLCICVGLAISLFRQVRQGKKGENRTIDRIVSKPMKPKAAGPEIKPEVHKRPDTSSGVYGNVQQQPPNVYEKTIVYQDTHIYEM